MSETTSAEAAAAARGIAEDTLHYARRAGAETVATALMLSAVTEAVLSVSAALTELAKAYAALPPDAREVVDQARTVDVTEGGRL